MNALEPRPLDVLAVASDRSLLRRLSHFLTAFGYRVRQAADLRQAQAAVDSRSPDFLLLDESLAFQGGLDLCRTLNADSEAGCLLSLLLVERPAVEQLRTALAAGLDDFLSKPLVYGEILARLRAAARTLEFERRAREQAGLERLTGLLSRSAFLAGLADVLAPSSGKLRRAACVALDLDFLERVNVRQGQAASDELIRAVSLHLVEQAGETAILACLGGGRFAALLPNAGNHEARHWAESTRASLAAAEFPVESESLRITASFGVAEQLDQEASPNELLARAEQALAEAKSSGRDCVALAGEFDSETRGWNELLSPEKWFTQTTAGNVMQPCILAIPASESIDHALALLKQFHLAAAPVVDAQGKFVGIFSPEKDLGGSRGSRRMSGQVKDLMSKKAPSKPESTPLSAVADFFAQSNDPLLVVVDDNLPVGVITRASLANLTAPLNLSSYSPAGGYMNESDYLVVG